MRISDWSSDVCSSDLFVARQAARAVDELLAAGTDLGPLMGVPIAVKDIIAVEGLPTSNGSKLPSEHLTGPEGPLVGQLKARSEEHTSELQSLMRITYAVFCLKKKHKSQQTKHKKITIHMIIH